MASISAELQEQASSGITASEIMVTAAAHEVRDGETAVVGIGLPQVACVLARQTHAPRLSMLLEIGVADMSPVDIAVGLADSRIFYRATCWSGFLDTLGMNLHRGVVDVGFIGGLEVDRFGNVNTTLTKDADGKEHYFNGSAGGNDVASLANRDFQRKSISTSPPSMASRPIASRKRSAAARETRFPLPAAIPNQ